MGKEGNEEPDTFSGGGWWYISATVRLRHMTSHPRIRYLLTANLTRCPSCFLDFVLVRI